MNANPNFQAADQRAIARYVDAEAISHGRMPVRQALPLWLLMAGASWGAIAILFKLLVG